MSPNRRDLFKRSLATVAGASIAAHLPVDDSPEVAARSVREPLEMYAHLNAFMVASPRTVGSANMDITRSADGTWTITAVPNWDTDTVRADDETPEVIRSAEHTAESLLDAVWGRIFARPPAIVDAQPFPEFDEFMDHTAIDWGYWAGELTRSFPPRGPWWSAEELREVGCYSIVTRRPDIMQPYAPHNAIIESANRYYLATLAA